MQKLTGRCLCEKVSYEITGPLGPIVNCHCSKCRRWHGAMFRTRSTINSKNFKWLSGEELLAKYYSSKNVCKYFCKVCGSNLISTYDDHPECVGVPLGGIEEDPGSSAQIAMNIYVGSKSPMYHITDDLPQYDTLPNDNSASLRSVTNK